MAEARRLEDTEEALERLMERMMERMLERLAAKDEKPKRAPRKKKA
jgi:hypothetical protein